MADNRKYTQAQPFTLYGAGAAIGDTSIILSSFSLPNGTLLTMSDFGTKGYGTLEPGNGTKEEAITFTGVVQNSNGTATLTGVKHQLFVDPYTETSGVNSSHVGGTTFVITNTAGFHADFTNKNDDETITGLWDFPSGGNNPTIGNLTYVAPTGDTQIATKKYVDTVATGNANYDQEIISGVAGENITSGWSVYLKSSDGKWYGTQATTSATSQGVILGIAQASASTDGSVNILISGLAKNLSGLTPGSVYYLSDTKGQIATTPGTLSVSIGECTTIATQLLVSQRFTQVPTGGEKSALAGDNTDIAIGPGNKYVTQTGFQANTEKYGVDNSASSTAYTVTLSPAPTAYTAGMMLFAKLVNANTTTTPTINFNGLGAKTIVKGASLPLTTGDISANKFCIFQYDGTNMVLQNPNTSPVGTVVPFYQRVGLSSSSQTLMAATTNTTGDVAYCVSPFSANQVLVTRWAFDSVSGMWYQTHNATVAAASGQISLMFPCGITLVGSFVYLTFVQNIPASETWRLAAADLTGGTQCSYSGGSPSALVNYKPSYTDGTLLYICSSTTTWKKYTISGTTLTAGVDVTSIDGSTINGATWDGSNVLFDGGTTIYKYTAAGASVSSIARAENDNAASRRGVGVCSLTSTILWAFAGVGTTTLTIYPVTKP